MLAHAALQLHLAAADRVSSQRRAFGLVAFRGARGRRVGHGLEELLVAHFRGRFRDFDWEVGVLGTGCGHLRTECWCSAAKRVLRCCLLGFDEGGLVCWAGWWGLVASSRVRLDCWVSGQWWERLERRRSRLRGLCWTCLLRFHWRCWVWHRLELALRRLRR